MHIFETVLLILIGAVFLTALARRVGAPYPAFLAMAGSLLAFVPGAPVITLDPALAMALFIAPILLDAAYDASPRDLKANWKPLAFLVLFAVGLTTAAVALVAKLLVPDMPWAVAIALGAVVAPPDAAAATAVLRQVRPPHRILTILEGESLLNDATALLIYRLAVGAAVAGAFSWGEVAPMFLVSVLGALLLGPALAFAQMWLLRRFTDAPSSVVLQFVGTFGVWLLAERLHVSAVLTVVAFGITAGQFAPARTPARLRIPSYAVWETSVFLLNVLAFSLIGLQLRPILERLSAGERWEYVLVALAVLVTVIVVRLMWVVGFAFVRRSRVAAARPHLAVPGAVLVGWCGMRGILTLAAALALPETIGAAPFPYRDLVLLTAFAVVVGTLIVQGLTLRPLLDRLALDDGDPVGQEVAFARRHALGAALAALEGEDGPEVEAVRLEYRAALTALDAHPGAPALGTAHDALRRRAVDAARRAALGLRASGAIGDDAFHRIEEDLDWAEMRSGSAG